MEHIVRSLGKEPELNEYLEEDELEDMPEEEMENRLSNANTRPDVESRASTVDARSLDGTDVNPNMERSFFGTPRSSKRFSTLSMSDIADRHLKDRTDAIADIIRNISDQCTAAVEGLQLTQEDGMDDMDDMADMAEPGHHQSEEVSEDGLAPTHSAYGSEAGENINYLSPDHRASSIPPTPDLVHNRSSTSMSITSNSTTPERTSQRYSQDNMPTKIIEDDESAYSLNGGSEAGDLNPAARPVMSKQPSHELMRSSRPSTARVPA